MISLDFLQVWESFTIIDNESERRGRVSNNRRIRGFDKAKIPASKMGQSGPQ
jgi:hypothetical protein